MSVQTHKVKVAQLIDDLLSSRGDNTDSHIPLFLLVNTSSAKDYRGRLTSGDVGFAKMDNGQSPCHQLKRGSIFKARA